MEQALEIVLQKIKSSQQASLREAEAQVAAWENENFPLYLYGLGSYICNPAKDTENRFLVGILLRRTLDAKDELLSQGKHKKWLEVVPEQLKTAIKTGVLGLLGAEEPKIRQIASQVVSSLALVELPNRRWPELIEILLNNVTNPQVPPNLKQATLETIGFILEEISPEVLQSSSDKILTAIVHGMRPDEVNVSVKRSACNALYHALDFCRGNFERPNERNVIMNVILDATANPDIEIRASGLAILVEVAVLHYDKLAPFMQKIFKINIDAIKDVTHDNVAKQAIEFWCTLCEEELRILESVQESKELNLPPPSRQCQFYIKGAVPYIAPLMTELLAKQEGEGDSGDWTLSMAAATCLGLMAQTVEDDIIQHVMPFVQQYIMSKEWRLREAAVMAFGHLLEGPKQIIGDLVTQAVPFLMQHMQDPKTAVKDITAYTIGRILKMHHKNVLSHAEALLGLMVNALKDKPRVAANAAWAIHNLSFSFKDEDINPMKKHFMEVVQYLLITSERPDADEENLRSTAYEALNVVLVTAPHTPGTEHALEQLLRLVLERLEKSFQMEKVSADDQNKQSELQGLLCGVIQVIIQKINQKAKAHADSIMAILVKLIRLKTETNVHEEAFLTVSSLINAIDRDFLKYMREFQDCLYMGLSKSEEYQVCSVAIGIVGDLCRALGAEILPCCDKIITSLLQNLQNRVLDRSVKPAILSCFGDIAIAIGSHFEKYLDVIMGMLKQATETIVTTKFSGDDDYELIDYMNSLREGILEAYTGIIQSLKAENKGERIFNHSNAILQLIQNIATDVRSSETVVASAVGICGDLAGCLGARGRSLLIQPFINDFITSTMAKASNKDVRDTCLWARKLITSL